MPLTITTPDDLEALRAVLQASIDDNANIDRARLTALEQAIDDLDLGDSQGADLNARLDALDAAYATAAAAREHLANRLTLLEEEDLTDDATEEALKTADATHEQRLAAVEAVDTAQAGTLEAALARIAALEAAGGGQSGTIVGLPATVITTPTDPAVRAGVTAWGNNRNAAGFAKTRLVFAFLGKAPLKPGRDLFADLTAGQVQGGRWEAMSKRGTQLGWSDPTVPIINTRGKLRNFRSSDLTLSGDVPGAKGILSWNSNAAGADQDWALTDHEWVGSWDYGLATDGPADYNLGSEFHLIRPACSNGASFDRGLLVTGLSGGELQLDQALNYWIDAAKFEGSHGPYIAHNRGGHTHITGGSWMHTGQSAPDGIGRGAMILMPKVPSHFSAVQTLTVRGVRAELRFAESKFLDSGWLPAGRIELEAVDTVSAAYRLPPFEAMTLRGGARLAMRSCSHIGWVGLRESGGIVDAAGDYYLNGMTRALTDTTGTGLVRRAAAGTPGTATFTA